MCEYLKRDQHCLYVRAIGFLLQGTLYSLEGDGLYQGKQPEDIKVEEP